MCLWSNDRKIPRIHGVPKGNRGKPRQDPGHYGDGTTKKYEGGAKPQRKNSGTEGPDEKEAARKLKVQAVRFVLIKDVLYKRGFSRPYLRCLGTEEADYVMREVHEGICGNHSGSRSLVHKLVRAGYYWPTMQKDAEAYVRACDKCQRFSNIIRQPTEELTPMTAPWPFAQWGLDIMGPFLTAVRQLKFLVVGIDYYTKWVEAEALATITEKNVRSFV